MVQVYSPDVLISQARRLAADYRRSLGKPLPGVGAEIALHDAIRLLGLEPRQADAPGGYDAIDPARDGLRIQIKSRVIFDDNKGGQRIGQLALDKAWDSVVLVLMDADYEPFEIYEAEREDILDYVGRSSPSRSKRGALSVARFKIIGRLVWSREDGLDPEVWDNQAS